MTSDDVAPEAKARALREELRAAREAMERLERRARDVDERKRRVDARAEVAVKMMELKAIDDVP